MSVLKFGFAISLLFFVVSSANAQRITAGSSVRAVNNDFVKKQFWIGPKFSLSRSEADAGTQSSSISPVDYEQERLNTEYNTSQPWGGSFGLSVGYTYYFVSLFFEPVVGLRRYSFTNDLSWEGVDNLNYTYNYIQRIDQFELPLSLHIDLLRTGFRPYAIAGAQLNKPFLGFLETEEYFEKANAVATTEQIAIDNTEEFPDWYGSWQVGLGAKWHVGNVLFFVQGTYGKSFGEINRNAQTSLENQFLTLGYSNDPVTTTNYQLDMGLHFPFRYLTNLYKSK
jgi:hypothetical protein